MTPAQRERLAKLCGMLGSDQVGERAAAAVKIEEFRRAHNLTWQQILSLAPAQSASTFTAHDLETAYRRGFNAGKQDMEAQLKREREAQPRPEPEPSDHREQLRVCNDYYHRLSEWEQMFIDSINKWIDRGYDLSPKQSVKLRQIYTKTKAHFGFA